MARPGLPVHEMVSPPPLIAVAVLVLNDHWLKYAAPGWWTGKLSDLAGLFYFPLLLTAGVRLAIGLGRALARRPGGIPPLRTAHLTAAVVATGLVFCAINLSPTAMALYGDALSLVVPSRGTVDPSDLLALPMLAAAWWWGRRFVEPPDGRLAPGVSGDA